MSDPNLHAQAPAPGWYPDASGVLRWWDGTAWTAHVQAPYAAAERPRLADSTPVDNAWIWVVALGSFVITPALFLIDMRGYMRSVMTGDPTGIMSYFGAMIVITVLGWGVTALCIVAAYRDYKHLVELGVVRPFHWAFAFIGTMVYLIGRHVVLRKVLRTSGWPLWAHIIAFVVYIIVIMGWTLWLVRSVFDEIAKYSSSYGY